MAFQYETVNSGGMSIHYHARSLKNVFERSKTYLWIQNRGWISVIIAMNKRKQTVSEVQKGSRA